MEQVLVEEPQYNVLCCICGCQVIPANPIAKCINCIKAEVDLTQLIESTFVVFMCKNCSRYRRPPWTTCEWKSKELLALCLKNVKGIQGDPTIKLVDAELLYTEPNSRRIEIQIYLEKELAVGTVVQQKHKLSGKIRTTQCEDCQKSFTPHSQADVVQLRQHVSHKLTLMYLEQVIIKFHLHEKVSYIKEVSSGLDFHFNNKSQAQHFVDAIASYAPVRVKQSKTLITHDPKNNTASYKYAFSVDICSICKDDLVILKSKDKNQVYGGLGKSFLICLRVTDQLHFVDPFTGTQLTTTSSTFWRDPFESVLTRGCLSEFMVLNVEQYYPSQQKKYSRVHSYQTDVTMTTDCNKTREKKQFLAEIEVMKQSHEDITRYTVRSHLGGILKPGDYCLGYDLSTLNISNTDYEKFVEQIPYDVVLVKKLKKRHKTFRWLIERLDVERSNNEIMQQRRQEELMQFKEMVEEDVVLSKNVSCYVDQRDKQQLERDSDVEVMEIVTLIKEMDLNSKDRNNFE